MRVHGHHRKCKGLVSRGEGCKLLLREVIDLHILEAPPYKVVLRKLSVVPIGVQIENLVVAVGGKKDVRAGELLLRPKQERKLIAVIPKHLS